MYRPIVKTLRYYALTAAAVVLASSALAQSATGNWVGHIKVNLSKQATQDPTTAAQVEQGLQFAKKMVFKLNLKSDMTYTMKVEGLPTNAQKDNTDTGTWAQKGSAITFASSKNKGKGRSLPALKISADGRAGVIDLPGGGATSAQIVFAAAK